MELSYAITLYFATIILTIIFLSYYGVRYKSSFVIALIVGQIMLNIICPPSLIDSTPSISLDSWMIFYYAIQLVSPIIIVVYAFWRAILDRTPRINNKVCLKIV